MVSSRAFPSLCDLDRAIQRELATLATIEADHRSACRWLDEWSAPEGVKEDLIPVAFSFDRCGPTRAG